MPEQRPKRPVQNRGDDTTPGVFVDWTRLPAGKPGAAEAKPAVDHDALKGWSNTELDRLPVYKGGSFYKQEEEKTPAVQPKPRPAEHTDSLDTLHPQRPLEDDESLGDSGLTTGAMLIEAAFGIIEARQDSLSRRNVIHLICAFVLFLAVICGMYITAKQMRQWNARPAQPQVSKEAPVDRRTEEF